MVYIIINKDTKKRVIRTNGKLTPKFPTADKALNYINDKLDGSKYLTMLKVNRKQLEKSEQTKLR